MLTNFERLMFFLLVAICLTATLNTFGQMWRIIQRGQGSLDLNDLPRRVWDGIVALFTQGSIIKHRTVTSLFHYAVAFGFIFFFLVNAVEVAEGVIPGFHFLEGTTLGNLYRLGADLFGAAVLVGVVYFFLRRFGAQDPALSTRSNVMLHPKVRAGAISADSLIVLMFIFIHISGALMAQAMLVAADGVANPWQPVASTIAGTFLSGLSPDALDLGWHISWWVAIGSIVLFLPYFPYTKHAHLFMGPFNFMTNPDRTYLGQMKTLDFENESVEQFGVDSLFDLADTRIVDAFACIMCNRCQEACPAYATGKELSPAALEINKRYHIRENMTAMAEGAPDELSLVDYAISTSAVWACTACGNCIEVCPVGNAPMLDIMDIRRDLVMMDSEFPEQLKGAFVGMERVGNPWQSAEDRMAWAEPLPFQVSTVEENPDYEYLLWVGCAGAFNPDAQKTVRALATILHGAGVSFAVLGDAETCTGDSARRAGNEYLYFEMASGNIETLNAAKANERRIVTSCPHCFTTIGKEYQELGGNYTVFHHTQLISDLVGKGKLTLKNKVLETTTFHDPCFLGRHNGVIAEPRQALADAGVTLLEMARNGKDSFCCGAGGAQYWKEEEHGLETINTNRFREAKGTGAAVLAVGCPFCGTMMNDANRAEGEPMKVRDVAELVVEAMG